MKKLIRTSMMMVVAALIAFGCSATPSTEGKRIDRETDAETTIAMFKEKDPSMERFFNDAYAYAVFPTVGKGAIGVGGAYGTGVLYEQGKVVGYSNLTQGTIGLQLGGQAYRQIIFFQYKEACDHFKSGNFAFAAQASAVAVTAGASTDADYDRGVVVFTMTKGGLMFEASIGGQKFSYAAK